MSAIDNKEIFITGCGSLAKALIKEISLNHKPRGIRVLSRGELNQHKAKVWVKENGWKNISFLIGDIRDQRRLELATKNCDILINTAALKRIEVCENDPIEAIETNVLGVQNVIYSAISNNIEKVFHISTDKAVYPVTLYGSTKKCAEDLIVRAGIYSRNNLPKFSCARYGNVFGSNGSVIQLFKDQKASGVLTITDQRMTRFWITLEKVAQFILDRISDMKGGEIFVPKMPSMSVMDIAKTIAPKAKIETVGIRGMEKLHEHLITEEENAYCMPSLDFTYFIIDKKLDYMEDRWEYTSDKNEWQLTKDELEKMLGEL